MDNNKKLFEGLLKADGIEPSNITESERMVFRQMLDREKKRMKHLSSLTVGAVWIFALAMLGLCLYEKIFEALRIPFVVGCLVIMAAMLIVMIRYMPSHNRKLRESGRKISKLYYLVHGKHRGIPLVGKKDGKRFIYWPRIIMIAVGLWLALSLSGAGVYYLLCQRWIISSSPILHIFYCAVISLSLVIFILRDGLKTPLDELMEIKTKPKEPNPAPQPNIWRIIMKTKITKLAAAVIIGIVVLLPLAYGAAKIVKHFLIDDIRIVVKDSNKISTEQDAKNAIQEFGKLYREGKAKEVKPGVWVVTLSNGEEFACSSHNPEWVGLSPEEKNKLLKAQNEEIQKLRETGNFERTFIKEVEENGVKIRLYEDRFTLSNSKVITVTFSEGQPPKKDAKKQ